MDHLIGQAAMANSRRALGNVGNGAGGAGRFFVSVGKGLVVALRPESPSLPGDVPKWPKCQRGSPKCPDKEAKTL